MPRETIRKLAEDVGRVLNAGAHLAAADPELKGDQAALDALALKLGDKAPVLRVLGENLRRAVGAAGKDAARELVSLATQVAQVRAAQAVLAPCEGALEPLAQVPEIGTPCNARDLYDLHDALVQSGQGRQEKVEQAIERGDVADLRLVDAAVQAIGDSWIGALVSQRMIPAFGPAIVAPVRARLRLKGGAVDGRRLRALVAVEKEKAQPLLEEAVKTGTAEVREAALDAIADHLPGRPELEGLVLELIEKERAGAVRRAAVRALAGYGSAPSLEALLAAFDRKDTREAAAEAVGSSKHPDAVSRLLEKLAEAVGGEGASGKKKAKPGDDARERAKMLLRALAPHADPRVAANAVELMGRFGASAAEAVVESGTAAQLGRVADLLSGDESDVFPAAVKAALRLGPDEAFRRLSAAFRAKDRDGKVGLLRLAAAVEGIGSSPSPQWTELLLKAFSSERSPKVQAMLARSLGTLGDRRAVPPLLKLLGNAKGDLQGALIQALGTLKDPVAIDPLIELCEGNGGWWVRSAILEINDVAAVDKVRSLVAKKKQPDWVLRSLLTALERRFPGA
jgi:HEAT repeat protein